MKESQERKQIYTSTARAVESEFTNPCFQSADIERSITVRIGIPSVPEFCPAIEAILKTPEGDKRIAYEPILSIPSNDFIRYTVQKFVTDCDITKDYADKLPKGFDCLTKTDPGFEKALSLKPETVIELVKDGVPIDREQIDKKIEELFPKEKSAEKVEDSTDTASPSLEPNYEDKEDYERNAAKDKDTSDVDVEPFGGAFVGGVERDDYDD